MRTAGRAVTGRHLAICLMMELYSPGNAVGAEYRGNAGSICAYTDYELATGHTRVLPTSSRLTKITRYPFILLSCHLVNHALPCSPALHLAPPCARPHCPPTHSRHRPRSLSSRSARLP